MTSYQKLREERDEYIKLFTEALTNLSIAKSTLWEIAALKDGDEWKAPKMAIDTLRVLKDNRRWIDEDTKNRK